MSALLALAGVGLALQVYGVYSSAEQAKEQAKLKKEDLALQEESLKLQEEARLMKEELAEAKVRADARKAKALSLVRSAVSGVDYSSADVAGMEAMETQLESGLDTQRELSGIATTQAGIQEERLDVASALIQEPSDLDTILGYTGAALGFGLTAMQTPEWKDKVWKTDYSMPMVSTDITYAPTGSGRFATPLT